MPSKIVLRPCHGAGAYLEGLYIVSDETGKGKREFARVPCCKTCFKAMGEPIMDAAAPEGWTTSSWNVMLAQHPRAPFNFKMYGNGQLLPETYKANPPRQLESPVTSAQAMEIAEEEREEAAS